MLETKAERFVFGFLALGLIFGFSLLSNTKNFKNCEEPYRKDVVIKVASYAINVEETRSAEAKARGLSGRNCIGGSQGMLFRFDEPGYYPFWMKDMKFNIDIIWINAEHKVVHIEKNLSPDTYPKSYVSPTPATDILELGAGRSNELGVSIESQLYY